MHLTDRFDLRVCRALDHLRAIDIAFPQFDDVGEFIERDPLSLDPRRRRSRADGESARPERVEVGDGKYLHGDAVRLNEASALTHIAEGRVALPARPRNEASLGRFGGAVGNGERHFEPAVDLLRVPDLPSPGRPVRRNATGS